MNRSNSDAPIERRLALGERREQLKRLIEIRLVEESIQKLYSEGHVRGSTHLSNGQEAIAVGLARSIEVDDIVTCTYRGHGHALALGVTPLAVIGEICGRSVGCAGGLGGSMHLMEPRVGLLPTFAIVGAGLPVACGAALAARVRGKDRVAVAIFGDGSTNIGAFHESLNFAAIRRLPVVFVCENNPYGEYTRIDLSTPIADIADRAAGYAMPSEIVDGQDVDAVAAAVARAVTRARADEGPTVLEMKTYRYSGHSRSDPATYRRPGELESWLQRDPIDLFAARLEAEMIIGRDELAHLKAQIAEEIAVATTEVLASPAPQLPEMLAHVTAVTSRGDPAWSFWSK